MLEPLAGDLTVPMPDTRAPWSYFHELVDRLTDGVTVQDATGKLVYANALGATTSGYSSPEALIAAPIGDFARSFEVMDLDGKPLRVDDLPGRNALRTGAGQAVLRVRHRTTGEVHYTDVRSFTISSPAGARFVVNIIRDVTAAVDALRAAEDATRRETEARERAELLAKATALLGESLDYAETLGKVAALVVPALADWCTVDVVETESNQLTRLAVAHVDPQSVQWAREVCRRFPPDMGAAVGVPHVLRTGLPEIYDRITDEMLVMSARSDDELAVLRQLELESAMLVPLKAGDRVAGVLSFVAAKSGKRFNGDDLAFAVELGRRAGHAIERSRLYSASTEHAQWLGRLQQLTVGLSRAVTFVDAIDATTNLGRQLFEADAVGIWLLSSDRTYLELGGSYGSPARVTQALQTIPVDAAYPVNEVLATGRPVVIDGADRICERFPAMAGVVRENGTGAIANAPIKVGGEIIGVLSFRYNSRRRFSDDYITALRTYSKELGQALDRTRIQSQLEEAKQAAEAANLAKSTFLATMSHELRTPINAILGFTELIELGIAGGQSSAEFIARIRSNTEHLLDLINDILDWSKVEAGQLAIDSAESLAFDVVHDAMSVVRQQALARKLELSADCGQELAYVGDPLRVRQILLNLLSNAIKFTPPHGRVTLTCSSERGVTAFSVADTGIGIDPRMIDSIFEPFVQASEVYTREYGGTGLGLSISRRLAHLMGGRLDVRSSPGNGSTFTLTLPASVSRPDDATTAAPAVAIDATMTIT